jgi:hypothetical protein
LKINFTGCAICDSTWGNVWAEVEGERRFFCCEICVLQFRTLVERLKADTGWDEIDTLEISGDRRGRTCRVSHGGKFLDFSVAFNPQGRVRRFVAIGAPAHTALAPPRH